jgi:glucokinase
VRIGLDIGGTKIRGVVLDDDGSVRASVRHATGFGASAVIDTAFTVVQQLSERVGLDCSQFSSIGVGIPGTVDIHTGRVTHAVNLGIVDIELGEALSVRTGAPVRVENDVNAAAMGAYHLVGGSAESMVYLNLGTGLAAGIVLGGELWRGTRGAAGEIGHIPIDPRGVVCACGQRGCLETVASGSAVARLWPEGREPSIRALFDAADHGEPPALKARRVLVENVASALRIIVLTLDVELIVIGGGMSSLGEELLAAVCGVLKRWELESPFLAALDIPGRIRFASAGSDMAAVGAALVGRGGHTLPETLEAAR